MGVKFCVGVGNGMDALEIGLRGLGIGDGDEVITTPMTAFATVLSIIRAGAVPVLADIDPETAMISAESAERCISPRTRAVMLVHLYGQAGPLGAILDLCNQRNIHLIEDCAQAHGAEFNGAKVGSLGAFSGWSFYPTKNLGAIGDGGALVTNSSMLAEKAKVLRNYGQSVRYEHTELGLNSRLDEIQAAILAERFTKLGGWTARRREIAHAYTKDISNPGVKLMPLPENPNSHVHHLFVVTCKNRNRFQTYMNEHEVQTLIHYPVPIHLQEPCKNIARDPNLLVVAETHAADCLSLPCHPNLKNEEVSRVIELVNSFVCRP